MTQVWLFIAPGLYAHEKKMAIPFVVLSSICFIGGAAFSHYVVFPLTWKFFGSFTSDYLTFMPRIEPAFALYIKMILAFGVVFQMPTIVLFLARMGVLTAGHPLLRPAEINTNTTKRPRQEGPCAAPLARPNVENRYRKEGS